MYNYKKIFVDYVSLGLTGLLLWAGTVASAVHAQPDDNGFDERTIAIVDGQRLTIIDYVNLLQIEAVKRFYHGGIPEAQRETFFPEIADKLVDRQLMIEEARQRNISPDGDAIEKRMARHRQRIEAEPDLEDAIRDERLATIQQRLEDDNLVSQLEDIVRKDVNVEEQEVRDFYRDNPDKFTTPRRIGVSVILLKVAPSSTGDVWQATAKQAEEIHAELLQGRSFEELAQTYSGDPSAEAGGDMGFLHEGMLSVTAQAAIDDLEKGGLTKPIRLLEGVAIFRLNERISAKLNAFDDVKERAGELLLRGKRERAVDDLVVSLRGDADIRINRELITRIQKGK